MVPPYPIYCGTQGRCHKTRPKCPEPSRTADNEPMNSESRNQSAAIAEVRRAALDKSQIRGLTHTFYRYPARFSPVFARAAISAFSRPGDVVLDPYMGGGTTVLESFSLGRTPVGTDINSLAVFVTRVKTDFLSPRDSRAIHRWARDIVPQIRCSDPSAGAAQREARNMALPSVRWLNKTIAQCIQSIENDLPTKKAQRYARCALLNVGQWALNGRRRIPSAQEFRARLTDTTLEMLSSTNELADALASAPSPPITPTLCELDAESIHINRAINTVGPADLVVTSPPYPGIHMLYHRWQVDGRKETDAPYWIAAENDGCGTAYYNFADRRRNSEDRYFAKAERSFSAVRNVMKEGAVLVQLIAFSEPERQLRRYLSTLERAGFHELREQGARRTWRPVPGRRWHASSKGDLPSSREVLLLHQAS